MSNSLNGWMLIVSEIWLIYDLTHNFILYVNPLGADPEERNSEGLTAFHVALKNGHMSIVKYFLENYSSKDSESRRSIYFLQSSASTSTLQYALESCIPEAVWLVLENKLCTESECKAAWKWIHSDESASRVLSSRMSKTGVSTDGKTQKKEDVLEEMRNLLSSYGGSTSPSQKVRTSKEEQKKQKATVEEYLPSPSDTSESSTLPSMSRSLCAYLLVLTYIFSNSVSHQYPSTKLQTKQLSWTS